MKKLLLLVILGVAAWHGYGKYRSVSDPRVEAEGAEVATALPAPQAPPPTTMPFSCDGRTYCSQMRSCAEATYFIRNCPNTRMDGNNDGIPCEQQWCN